MPVDSVASESPDRSLTVRRVRFQWPDDAEVRWTPRVPELAIAANSISLLMPHLEPFIVSTVRRVADEIDDPQMAAQAKAYAAQEAAHHGQHRRFNRHLVAEYPKLARTESLMARFFARMATRSPGFGLALAVGAETVAFTAARWVDEHNSLLRDGDPITTTMFLWHLAEEVEHKEVAWDLYAAHGGGRVRLALGMVTAVLMMATFAFLGSWKMLRADGRLLSPTSHFRLARWTIGFAFSSLPIIAVALFPGHHPRDLVDPSGLEHWLDYLDLETATVPEWALP